MWCRDGGRALRLTKGKTVTFRMTACSQENWTEWCSIDFPSGSGKHQPIGSENHQSRYTNSGVEAWFIRFQIFTNFYLQSSARWWKKCDRRERFFSHEAEFSRFLFKVQNPHLFSSSRLTEMEEIHLYRIKLQRMFQLSPWRRTMKTCHWHLLKRLTKILPVPLKNGWSRQWLPAVEARRKEKIFSKVFKLGN